MQNKKKLRCFLEKFTQLTKILHDRRSRRSRQISSLDTESITSINGCSEDEYGWILSLQAETTTGTSWGPVGDHQPDDNFSLRPSPRGKIKLAFISGREDEMYDNYCLRCQLPPIISYNLCLCCNRTTNDHYRQINKKKITTIFAWRRKERNTSMFSSAVNIN